MNVRPAVAIDLPAITILKNIKDDERYSKRITATQNGTAVYLLAEENSKIVGQVFLKYYGTPKFPTYPNMEDLIVGSGYRNRGIGTALINECETLSKGKGFTKIGLSVNPTLNQAAMSLYTKLGYKSLGSKPYLSGVYNGTEDWVIDLVKEL